MLIDWEDTLNSDINLQKFSAIHCNELTHKAIAMREREFISEIILNAANKGCFSTILPTINQDTKNWLHSLGFSILMNNCGINVCWDDKVIKE